MDQRRKPYPFDTLEPKWQEFWATHHTFSVPNPGAPGFDASKPKFYVLDMFPYPSGTGLHVGHPVGYIATDIIARYRRMMGFNVLHPMGWDAFGLPAEQYAIKTGQHPEITTRQNIARFKEQLQKIGLGYDWAREVNTTDPGYYQWTQWIFLQIYHSWFNPETKRAEPITTYSGPDPDSVRLAYVAEVPVNWCQELGTVLANEEVVEGKSEVGGFPVVRRPMRQWMLRITAFADRLIDELAELDWPESIKTLQRNWIGRSEGAEVNFTIAGYNIWKPAPDAAQIKVFTTRPDTLFGATYMVLAPENPLVDQITTAEQRDEVEAYRAAVRAKSDMERTDAGREKTGVFTGAFAINPVNSQQIPIWVADYVLMGYGTGAIMAVPAHDERDFAFAGKFGLEIRRVVRKNSEEEGDLPFTEPGVSVNSPLIDGLATSEAQQAIIASLEGTGFGKRTINFKLRDWLFSRQRYWGEPFPIVWEEGQHRAVSEAELPVRPPPLDDFKPTGTGEPPLAKARAWVRYSDGAARETNTMPQWAGSCWYYLRYCDPRNTGRFVDRAAEQYWMGGGNAEGGTRNAEGGVSPEEQPITSPRSAFRAPRSDGGVDLYVGGTEHAVLHLLYARFWHKVLFDLGQVSTPEPFQRLVNQGLMLGDDGQKMSKSRGNVVNPDDVIATYGADSLRCYEMFMGPLKDTKPWSVTGVEGVFRFLARVWRLVMEENQAGEWVLAAAVQDVPADRTQLKVIHATIKKVGADIEELAFNTAISQMMIFVNAFTSAEIRPVSAIRALLQVLNPFAPHITEELWQKLGEQFDGFTGTIAEEPWPQFEERHLLEDEIEIPVQVNGKVRGHLTIKKEATREELETAALASERVAEFLAGKQIRKVVVVPGKLVNIVAS